MKILSYGDSHIKYLTLTDQIQNYGSSKFKNWMVDNNIIRASSIKGFGRRKSTLNVSNFIDNDMVKKKFDFLVLGFGQVDIELGYYYSTYVKGEVVEFNDYCNLLVGNYFEFIKKLKINPEKIVMKGVNLPVLICDKNKAMRYTHTVISENINDELGKHTIKNKMRESFPSDKIRINRHLLFNEMLKEKCNFNSMKYFDVNDRIVDSNGDIKVNMIPANQDHHLPDTLAVRIMHFKKLFYAIKN